MPYCWWNFRVNNWFTNACDCGAQTHKHVSGVPEITTFPALCRTIYEK
ncbi:hypothetical protein At1D1108_09270 [Agrobacterium tumefaciens]|jgi:hypothetical protein|nr:hypothetical protein At1D1108_09270 [Agrobacterium tumefaciens]